MAITMAVLSYSDPRANKGAGTVRRPPPSRWDFLLRTLLHKATSLVGSLAIPLDDSFTVCP